MQVVVFIQNHDTKEIYQTQSTRNLQIYYPDPGDSTGTSVEITAETFEVDALNLYPNPAMDYFTVAFERALDADYEWSLVDVLGREWRNGLARKGTAQFNVNTYDLPTGTYFFVISNQKIMVQRQVIIRRP